jgi:hypothetical protein
MKGGKMLAKLYEMLWSRIGGQPWTYIIRGSYKRYPLLWWIGAATFGMILGHLFW